MTPVSINATILGPLFHEVLPAKFDSPQARVMLLAICGHEADFEARVQRVNGGGAGPARGLLQFERGGGVAGVLNHPDTSHWAAHVCLQRGVEPSAQAVHHALAFDDLLAFAFGRLLLYSDPKPLPAIGAEEVAFQYYLRNWRPGAWYRGDAAARAKLRAKWSGYYTRAVEAIEGLPA